MAEHPLHDRIWKLVMRVWPTRRAADAPFTPLRKPLAEARVALITSCGTHLTADPPFETELAQNDVSFRALPGDVRAEDVTITHDHYDARDARKDLNVVFPIDRLRELAAEGAIGSVAAWHYGFMGSIMRPERLVRDTAPEVARRLRADAVDVVLLTPC